MNIKTVGPVVYVTLSRRNLDQLLQAYDQGYAAGLVRQTEDNTRLYIRVESNEDHYGDRIPGPGLDTILKEDK